MIAAFLITQGADPTTLATLRVPLWVVPVAAIAAYICATILKMCYPGIQLPTTANTTSHSGSTSTKTDTDSSGKPVTTTMTSNEAPTKGV